MRKDFAEQPCHRRPFVDKDTDEAARLCQRQRVTQLSNCPVVFAMRMKSDRLQNHHLESFILLILGFHLQAQWRKQSQGRGRITLGQTNSGLAKGEFVGLGQLNGSLQIDLSKQD